MEPPVDLNAADVYRSQVLGSIGQAGLAAAGAGAAWRGIRGLLDTWQGTHTPPPKMPLRQQFVTVPIARQPKLEGEDEEKVASGPYTAIARAMHAVKQADQGLAGLAVPAAHLLQGAGLTEGAKGSFGPFADTVMNPQAKSPSEMPWAMVAAPLAIGGGAYLGHQLMDSVLGKSKAYETDTELADAKKRYERALLPKAASAEPDPLDQLYDYVEKKANVLGGALNTALGGYGLLAATLMGGSGVAAYNWMRDRSEDKAVQNALKKRHEQLFASGPPPIVAVPEESDPYTPKPHLSMADVGQKFRAVGAGIGSGISGLAGRAHAAMHPEKDASLSQAADSALQRFNQQQQQVVAQTAALFGVTPQGDKKPAASAKPAQPPAPVLPSVVQPPAQPAS